MATITAVMQHHPAEEASEERLSETMNERETGTVPTEMLHSEMKCFGTTSTDTSGTTSMGTSETTNTETITTGKVEIWKDPHKIIETATKETTRGMAAGRCSSMAMVAIVKRGEDQLSMLHSLHGVKSVICAKKM